ncbi:3-hydroxyacyl-CoA dehydrogenase family protein [Sediminibacterium ginsengisoli]|uniref:3-hydroxybutyryl-CoA dehydrogenase n=1 Tax=Sediminibacterium ginsengisoli TaxID=413434 RepID=A0A1T4LWH3_9BACT|nr:3-hydroxyacyl-CoA dehydrogenase family protein [Sediminibacterium ginsengisoli]SJZ58784.1 3-hydroxybutyryl-CoA dehydrogenase [Sediminibacterium ginsengisoli]
MHIVVNADQAQQQILLAKGFTGNHSVTWYQDGMEIPEADVYFDLAYTDHRFTGIRNRPVFVNAVTATCASFPDNHIRFNGWNSFLERNTLELAAAADQRQAAEGVLAAMGWSYRWVADEPGMISARIVAMIINEAYFAIGDEISSRADIDTAMKLGTNYPYGPFEWAGKIGIEHVYGLLKQLSASDARYLPAPVLEQEAKQLISAPQQ